MAIHLNCSKNLTNSAQLISYAVVPLFQYLPAQDISLSAEHDSRSYKAKDSILMETSTDGFKATYSHDSL